jgi:hypothetical protein
MSTPWWAAFGPAQTHIDCGAGQHRMQWSDGQLQAADHPDAEGELVLAALGGDATPCLDLARAWGKHSDNLTVLAIGPRSDADKLTFSPETLEQIAQARTAPGNGPGLSARTGGQFVSAAATGRAHRSRRSVPLRPWPSKPSPRSLVHGWAEPVDAARGDLIWLLALGSPLQFRLSGAVAHAWSADGQHASRAGQASPALTAALTGRLAPAAARWLGTDPAVVDASIHEGSGWGAIEEARAGAGRRLQARLPVSWLARIWAPGLAVVGGHLVVSVVRAAWPTADVLALAAPGQKPVELSIRDDGQGWITA